MGSYFESKFAAQSERKQGSKKTLKKLKVFQDYYHRYYQNLDGCDHWKEDSFHGSAHIYEECEGNDMIPFKGNKSYSDVLKHFLDQIPRDKIKFDSRVETIDYSAEDSVKVVLADGQSRMSQHVIVTVSLGVLKHEAESMFVPALPKSKLEAIRNIGFGVVDKIFLEWKEPWWPVEDSEGIAFLYQEPIDYTKEDAEMDWTRFVCGFYRVLHRPNVMCLWLSGHGARVMEGRTEEKVQMQVMTFLRKFLTKECGTIPEPTGMKARYIN